jgi:hypothetical protein
MSLRQWSDSTVFSIEPHAQLTVFSVRTVHLRDPERRASSSRLYNANRVISFRAAE